jgi:hypothetical protein
MSTQEREPGILARVTQMLTTWLRQVRQAVLRAGPNLADPSAVYETTGEWGNQVDRLLDDLEDVASDGWASITGEPYVSTNAFVLAQLALTRNLLVRMPDEVYNLIFEQITIGQTDGETVEQIAARIDRVLMFTGSQFWPNRAKVIAVTETHRAWQSGALAAAQTFEPQTGPAWTKTWDATKDMATRPAHRRAHGQTRRLRDTFQVGGDDLIYPGDPAGMPGNVINCRCDMIIKEA